MIDNLDSVFSAILEYIRTVAGMYTIIPLLAIPIALWIFRKVVDFFRHVLPF